MAEQKYTVFQRLQRVLSNGSTQKNYMTNNYDIVSPRNSDIIATASSKEEYERKVLQAKQQALLGKQWIKANYDITNQSLAGLNDVRLMYRDADLMDAFPEIGAALDIVAEESCLHGGTVIKLLNGQEKTIEELYKQNYKDFWVYSVDKNGNCKPSKIERVICNGIKPIIEIGLDDGTIIKCTNNHKWLLSSNIWKRTDELEVGESLMSIYDKLDHKGYEKIKSTVEDKFSLTHRVVAENVLYDDKKELSRKNKPYQKIVIHHKSFNKLNNDPNELVYMFWNDHQKLHTDLNSERWLDKNFANKMKKIFSEVNKKLWLESDRSELREKLSIAQRKRVSKFTDEERKEYYGRKGENNGMYGVHRFGNLNPNFNKNKKHIDDIDENEYINFIINSKVFPSRNLICKNFNLQRNDVIKLNKKICKKYGIKNVSSIIYLLKPNYRISDIKKCISDNPTLLQNQIAKKLGITYHSVSKAIEVCGYSSFEDLKTHLSNHIIRFIRKTEYSSNVYDLVNSSCNNCFGVKCNKGQIISHNCFVNENGTMININSRSDRVKSILEDLFVNRLSIHMMLPMICRSMCKYGNTFMLLNIDAKNGVLGWKQLPVYEMERWENGQNSPYSSPITNLNTVDENAPQDTKFAWIGQTDYVPYRNWQIAHFRLLYDSLFLPYGVSYLNKARRHFRMLSMMEDMMLIYRLDRSIERRVFKINVGAIDENDVQAYVQEIANNFKRKPIVDPLTGQIDLRKSFMNVTEDFFIPTRDDNASSPIETLQGAQNLTAMDDIKFVQNKVLTALRVPKSFLNFEEAAGDGKNLSLLDVRFTRTVNRIQQSLLMELNKIAIIHLYLNGFQDELNNFTLTMNNPSSQAEMLELENLAKKITTAKDAVSDPGGGMPLMSMMWAWKHIFKWSDKEIKQNLEELRLETALSAELQKTMQIIKKTGLFDGVDNIYGEPGAEYMDDNGGGQGEDDGMGGGPAGGGMPMGGGMDFGDEGPDMGAEGEMDMDMAAEENGAADMGGGPDMGGDADMGGGPSEDGGSPPPNLAESILKSMSKKVLNEKKRVSNDILKRSKHYADILEERLLKNKTNESINNTKKVDIYDKAFFLNEEMNSLKTQLEKINDDFSSNEE